MKINYKGPTLDPSGYGQAARDYITALHLTEGVELTVTPWNFEQKNPEFYGAQGELVQSLKNRFKPSACDVALHHYVPNQVQPLIEPGTLNVGYNTWETTGIPQHWVENINNNFDLNLVPSHFNQKVYEDCGVCIPVEVVHHCFDIDEFGRTDYMYPISELGDRHKFLSVFQWTERKNPIGLLKAYFSEFTSADNVVLVLKVYGSNTSHKEQNRLKNEIVQLKHDMRLSDTAPVYMLSDLMSRSEMLNLYRVCDTFVLPTRGEGFGMPLAEAAASRLPIITTGFSGHMEFLSPAHSNLLDYFLTPVAHMPWIPHYDGRQHWAEPDLYDLQLCMRDLCGRDQYSRAASADNAHKIVKERLNYETVGKSMRDTISKYL